MIEITIPGRGELCLQHLVLDVNGTLAVDGQLIEGVIKRISNLKTKFDIHMLTANTHGAQSRIDHYLNLQAVQIAKGNEGEQKAAYVEKLGSQNVVAIGQGANDALMLRRAELGICVLSVEGTAKAVVDACDLLMPDINSALDLFEYPLRLIASLRT